MLHLSDALPRATLSFFQQQLPLVEPPLLFAFGNSMGLHWMEYTRECRTTGRRLITFRIALPLPCHATEQESLPLQRQPMKPALCNQYTKAHGRWERCMGTRNIKLHVQDTGKSFKFLVSRDGVARSAPSTAGSREVSLCPVLSMLPRKRSNSLTPQVH